MTKTKETTDETATVETTAAGLEANDSVSPDTVEKTTPAEDEAARERALFEQAETTVRDLVRLDVACRAQGHTLAQILAKTAQNVFGLDVTG